MSISGSLMRYGKTAMDAADATAKSLGPLNGIAGGARGLSGTDMMGGSGAMLYCIGKVLHWIGL